MWGRVLSGRLPRDVEKSSWHRWRCHVREPSKLYCCSTLQHSKPVDPGVHPRSHQKYIVAKGVISGEFDRTLMMSTGFDSAALRCADGLASKSLQLVNQLQRALFQKPDPSDTAWWDGIEWMKSISSFFGREEISIHLQYFPPRQSSSLFNYYQGIQVEPRLLPATVVRLAALPLVDFYFPTKPVVRRVVCGISVVFLLIELFPSVAFPIIHDSVFWIARAWRFALETSRSSV
ncbi:putative transmembrane protein [Toxoplasma gondii RUB]|uniref:Putative transmembrane protein n=1 Tax=Toxoplasma gondii RUB TaxID=935652 RepID=A0A086LQ98_TOXGO|nr:putative transmembrane protein [Toxoplasma gondii RUB]